jgi:signal transduction histidine kinase
VAIDVVVVGDCELDERSEAVLGAAREAIVNAAKHAGEAGPIRVYAEVDDDGIELFVRDRGPGFDPATIPADRQGVRESIIGRMERVSGTAEIRSAPDGGTEVGLAVRQPAAEREGGAS